MASAGFISRVVVFSGNVLTKICTLLQTPEIKMKSRFLNIVTQRTAIFQLLPVKDKTLLIRRDTFFVLNFCFHHLNDVCRFHLQNGRLFRHSSYKYLHATTNSLNQNEESLSEHSPSDNDHIPIASHQR